MASKHQDTYMFITLAVVGYVGAWAVHEQLLAVRKASKITQEEQPPDLITQHTEDALKLDTLWALTQGANPEIRNAALKIITERAARGACYHIILTDIAGQDTERRDRALVCIKYLSESPGRYYINNRRTYQALIDCLCNILEDYPIPKLTISPTTHRYRTQPERDALTVLRRTMCYNLTEALDAGLISRWLLYYPFGGSSTYGSRKRALVQELRALDSEDEVMSDIVNTICSEEEGWKQMIEYGLVEEFNLASVPPDGQTAYGVSNQGSWHNMMTRGRRVREESVEEQALRRRRREAMVLNEGGRPFEGGDIIHRDHIIRDEDVEEELEQLVNEVRREHEEAEAQRVGNRGWWWTRWHGLI